MRFRPVLVLTAAMTAALLPGARLAAQQPAPPGSQLPDSVRALVEEAREIQRRLAKIQQQALDRNPALRDEGNALEQSIGKAMREADPQLERRLGRLDELRSEFVAARRANDLDKARSLLAEAQRIQKNVARTRAEVVQREDLAREMEAFEERMLAAMEEVDPETDRLIARLDEITSRLNS